MEDKILAELQKINAQLAQLITLSSQQPRVASSRNLQQGISPQSNGASIAAEVQRKIEEARRAADLKTADGFGSSRMTAGPGAKPPII